MDIAISCDLDDTLIPNQEHYNNAKETVAQMVMNKTDTNISTDEITDRLDEIDREKYDEVGVTKSRFADSCSETVSEMVGDDSQLSDEAWNVGRDVFKSEDEYAEVGTYAGFNGFMSTINQASRTVLLTAGMEDVQRTKIRALGLDKAFDETRIVSSDGKKGTLNSLNGRFSRVVHIGNSVRSDIKPAQSVGVDAVHIGTSDWLGDDKEDSGSSTVWSASSLSHAESVLTQNIF